MNKVLDAWKGMKQYYRTLYKKSNVLKWCVKYCWRPTQHFLFSVHPFHISRASRSVSQVLNILFIIFSIHELIIYIFSDNTRRNKREISNEIVKISENSISLGCFSSSCNAFTFLSKQKKIIRSRRVGKFRNQ